VAWQTGAIAIAIAIATGCATGDGGNEDGAAEGLGGDGGTTASAGSAGEPGGPGPGEDGGPGGPDGSGSGAAMEEGGTTTPGCDTPTTWYADKDGDGFGSPDDTVEACVAPPGYIDDDGDCDDEDQDVHPGAIEPCGGPDLDCDGVPADLCASCLQLLESGNGTDDGLYTIDIDGSDGAEPPIQVYCDQTTAQGGWTLVQRTVWDPALTAVLATTYTAWRDVTVGSASGGAYRLQGGRWPAFNQQQDHLLRLDVRDAGDGSDCAPLFYVGEGGVLEVSRSTATITGLTAPVNIVNSSELTASDQGPSPQCIAAGGVPWFYGSCCSTCPTYQGSYWSEPHPMAAYPDDTADMAGNTTADVCPGGPQLSTNPEHNYVGVNQMSYWLR
jgi:hypothetical protein